MKTDLFHLLDNSAPKLYNSDNLKKKVRDIKVKTSRSPKRKISEDPITSVLNIIKRPEIVENTENYRVKKIKNCLTKTLDRNSTPITNTNNAHFFLKKSKSKNRHNYLLCESPRNMNFNKIKNEDIQFMNPLVSSIKQNITARESNKDVMKMRLEFMNYNTNLDLSNHDLDLNLLSENSTPPSPKKQYMRARNSHKKTQSFILN